MNHLSIEGFVIDELPVGAGCTGEVFRATHSKTGERFVVKRFNSMSIDRNLMETSFRRYLKIPEHDGIVPLKAYQLDETPYLSIAKYERGRVLADCDQFSEEQAWQIIEKLAETLGHAHKYGLIHGNLHPGNIFYYEDEDGDIDIRVTDFAAGLIGEVHHVDLGESAYFAAPEQLKGLGFDYSESKGRRWDVYRFGAIAFWLLNHQNVRGKAYRKSRAVEIANSGGRPVPLDPIALAVELEKEVFLPWRRKVGTSGIHKPFRVIIEKCLDIDPEERPVDLRDVRNDFKDLEAEYKLNETIEDAVAAVNAAEGRVVREKLKQKAKLFSARASATIFAASCIIATFFLITYLNKDKESKSKLTELDQDLANHKAHISILGSKVQDREGDLKESREAADASFYSMAQRISGNQAEATLIKELERSRKYYAGILKEVSAKPDSAAEKGRALHSLAHIEKKLSRNKDAMEHFSKAIETFESSVKSANSHFDEAYRQDTVMRLADCYENVGRLNTHPEVTQRLSLYPWRFGILKKSSSMNQKTQLLRLGWLRVVFI